MFRKGKSRRYRAVVGALAVSVVVNSIPFQAMAVENVSNDVDVSAVLEEILGEEVNPELNEDPDTVVEAETEVETPEETPAAEVVGEGQVVAPESNVVTYSENTQKDYQVTFKEGTSTEIIEENLDKLLDEIDIDYSEIIRLVGEPTLTGNFFSGYTLAMQYDTTEWKLQDGRGNTVALVQLEVANELKNAIKNNISELQQASNLSEFLQKILEDLKECLAKTFYDMNLTEGTYTLTKNTIRNTATLKYKLPLTFDWNNTNEIIADETSSVKLLVARPFTFGEHITSAFIGNEKIEDLSAITYLTSEDMITVEVEEPESGKYAEVAATWIDDEGETQTLPFSAVEGKVNTYSTDGLNHGADISVSYKEHKTSTVTLNVDKGAKVVLSYVDPDGIDQNLNIDNTKGKETLEVERLISTNSNTEVTIHISTAGYPNYQDSYALAFYQGKELKVNGEVVDAKTVTFKEQVATLQPITVYADGTTSIEVHTYDMDIKLKNEGIIQNIGYNGEYTSLDDIKTDILENILDQEKSAPKLNTENMLKDVKISYQKNLVQWEALDEKTDLAEFATGVRRIRLTYAGNDQFHKMIKEFDAVFVDTRKDVTVECGDVEVLYSPDEAALKESILSQMNVKLFDGENELTVNEDDITINLDKLSHSTGTQTVNVTFKGNKEYKEATVAVSVNIQKAPLKITVNSQSIKKGETITDLVSTQYGKADGTYETVDLDTIRVITGVDTTANATVYVQLPSELKSQLGGDSIVDKLPDGLQNILGNLGVELSPYTVLKKIFENSDNLTELIQTLKNSEQVKQLLKAVLNEREQAVLGAIVKALEAVDLNTSVVTDRVQIVLGDEMPTNVGVYLVTATSINSNYETAVGTGYITIGPKIENVTLTFNSDFTRKGNIISYKDAQEFDFGGSVVGNEDVKVRTRYTGVTFAGKVVSSTEAIREAGVYTEVVYVLDGTYVATPIVRMYTVLKATEDDTPVLPEEPETPVEPENPDNGDGNEGNGDGNEGNGDGNEGNGDGNEGNGDGNEGEDNGNGGEDQETPDDSEDPWAALLAVYSSELDGVAINDNYLMATLEGDYEFHDYVFNLTESNEGIRFFANFLTDHHDDLLEYINYADETDGVEAHNAFTYDYEVDFLFEAEIIQDPRVMDTHENDNEWHTVTLTGVEHDEEDVILVAHYDAVDERYELVQVTNHDGNTVTFMTQSFSPFYVARVDVDNNLIQNSLANVGQGNQDSGDDGVATGDYTDMARIFELAALCGLAFTTMVIVVRKRRS